MLESFGHKESVFTTLTYSDENLPENGNLKLTDLQNFLKRYRKNTNEKFRYFAVGEYGSKQKYKDNRGRVRIGTERPHYHIVLFGQNIQRETDIQHAWNLGRTKTESLCAGRAAYIVGYTTEKLTKKSTALMESKRNQFATMSKNEGGIGLKEALLAADSIKSNAHWEKVIITSFQYGKKTLPLGRYLAERVNERLGIEPGEFEKLLFERQFDIFKTHVFTHNDRQKVYYDKLLSEHAQKRKNREAKFKQFRRRKSI